MSWLKRIGFLLLVIPGLHCESDHNDDSTTGTITLKDSVIVSGLNHPWEILWGPDDHIWMTERGGRISRVNPTSGIVTPLTTINEVVSMSEGGLLGMVLHPDFASNPHVYVVYNYNNTSGQYREKIVRYTYNGTTLINPFLIRDNILASSFHNGSRMLIINDKLFVTTGDATNQSLSQDPTSINGKILRLNLDGSIPSDNPVAGNAYWSTGHRNPQGLVFANNILYSSEHGPANDDELNIIEKGRNYGWPDVQGLCDNPNEQSFCGTFNVKEPLKAACGLDYYNNDLIPQWKNSLLLATLKNTRLYQMKLDNSFTAITSTDEFFNGKYGRLRDLCISPGGRVYICTSNGGNDQIVEIKPG